MILICSDGVNNVMYHVVLNNQLYMYGTVLLIVCSTQKKLGYCWGPVLTKTEMVDFTNILVQILVGTR